jgi:hypothetical protein
MCSNNENLKYLTVSEYNKIMEARKQIILDDKYKEYTEKKVSKLLGINPWLDNYYIKLPNKGGKKSKTKNSKNSKNIKKTKLKTMKNKKHK